MWKSACSLALAVALASGTALAAVGDPEIKVSCTEFDLPNGLHVILHEDHTIPMVHTNIWYRVGSSNEQVGRTGFAHLFEHLMFEGSGHVKEGEFDRLLESVGGSNNASTSSDRTNYYCTVPSCALELPLFLESDRMGFLLDSMSPNVVDSQRDVVKNEMRQSYLNRPYAKMWLEVPRLLYPKDHPYNWPVIGSMEDLSAAGYEDVVNFFKTYYLPNNASLVVAGDIDPVETKKLIEKWFSDVKAGKEVKKVEAKPVEVKGVVKKTLTDKVTLPMRAQIWPTPALYQEGDADMDILGSILSTGKNSRLYKRLVYETQLAQTVSAQQVSSDLGSFFLISYIPRPGHTVEEIQAVIREEIEKLQREYPSQAELDRALNINEFCYLSGMEHCSGKADMLNNYYVHFGKPDSFAEDLNRYRKVTPQSVSVCAKKYIDFDNYVEITVIPEKEAK
ncbi:insulinase family protein [bacterium]|nr:insulinase family protein [bacterium]